MRRPNIWLAVLAGLALALALGVGEIEPRFLALKNVLGILRQSAPLAIFALAQMLPILTRGLDLSQGGVVVATSVIFALVAQHYGTGPGGLAVIGIGVAIGLANGAAAGWLSLPIVVVTLSTGALLEAAALALAHGEPVTDVPNGFSEIDRAVLSGIPVPVLIVAVIAFGMAGILRFTLAGRYIYAIGSNRRAAALSGVPVTATLLGVYAACSGLTALGSVMLSSHFASGQPTVGSDASLQAVAAAAVGGVSLFGGRGTVSGCIAGAILLGFLASALKFLGVPPFLQLVAIGLAMLAGVMVDRLRFRAPDFVGLQG